MIEAMLDSMLRERLGAGSVDVHSSGFGPVGLPPIDEAVEAMRRRGVDISSHRSTATTRELVERADVILTAERQHVVKIAALSPDAFRQAMTLPEFLAAAASSASGEADEADGVRSWIRSITEHRTASAYLREPVPEVADPTGSVSRVFESAVVTIEQQCREVAALLVSAAER
jgi:protein-tyrosine-phosphatase